MKFGEIKKSGFVKEHYNYWNEILYDYLALPLVWVSIKLRLKPNIITLIGLFIRLISLYFYIVFLPFLAIFFFVLGYILDAVDGIVARVTNKCSRFGALFDYHVDFVTRRIFYGALTIGIFLKYNNPFILILGLVFVIFLLVREVLYMGAEKRYKNETNKRIAMLKGKFDLISLSLKRIIELNEIFFPFIVLFPFLVIEIYYFFNILLELVRFAYIMLISYSAQNQS